MTIPFDQDSFAKAALAYGSDASVSKFLAFVRAEIGDCNAEQQLAALGAAINAYQVLLSGVVWDKDSSRRFEQLEQLLQEAIKIAPDDAYNWIALSEHYHYYAVNLQKARSTIETAVEKALAEKNFVRQAYGVLIRIALAQGDFGTVERSLGALVDYAAPTGTVDVALEQDFIARIPEGSIQPETLDRYRARLRA